MKYFITMNSLLKCFDSINISHMPQLENQKANNLAQISPRYKVSKETLEELIEVKDKLISTEFSPTTSSRKNLWGHVSLGTYQTRKTLKF